MSNQGNKTFEKKVYSGTEAFIGERLKKNRTLYDSVVHGMKKDKTNPFTG